MTTHKLELAINITVSAALLAYILSITNPDIFLTMKNYMQYARWYMWNASTAGWMKEALQVRGYIP